VKRLLQLATAVLLLAGLIAPIVEFFDQWDPEGLEDDTEFGAFALIFVLCLVLQVCRLISSAALQFSFGTCGVLHRDEGGEDAEGAHGFIFVIPRLFSPPLRI
jgi:hypothetical protein